MLHRVPFEDINLSADEMANAGMAFRSLCHNVLKNSHALPEIDVIEGGAGTPHESQALIQVTDQARLRLGPPMLATICRDVYFYSDDSLDATGNVPHREWYSLDVSQRKFGRYLDVCRYVSATEDLLGEVIRKDWDRLPALPRKRGLNLFEEREAAMCTQQALRQNGLPVGMGDVNSLHLVLRGSRFAR